MRYLGLNLLLLLIVYLSSCDETDFDKLSQKEKDYIERFNVVVKDIRDWPPTNKNIEKYFHIFKSVPKLEDAKIIFLGEIHTHSSNKLWSAGAINRMIQHGDIVLFEGWHGVHR